MKATITVLTSFIVVLAFATCEISLAQSSGKSLAKGASKEYRKTKTGKGALTPKMLENCIIFNKDVTTVSGRANDLKSKVENKTQELTKFKKALEEKRKTIDQTDSVAVETFNAEVAKFNSDRQNYTAMSERYNKLVEEYNGMRKQYIKECSEQSYYQDDYDAVVKKLGFGM